MGRNIYTAPVYAFPKKHITHSLDSGMTLRDYFAAKAMQSLMPRLAPEDLCMEDIATFAYLMADQMIEERDDTDS